MNSALSFQQKLRNYAELLVRVGMNVQAGQLVVITAEVCHRDLAYLAAEFAYRQGAKLVTLDLIEPRLSRLRIMESSAPDLAYVPSYLVAKFKEIVDEGAATLRILGSEFPDSLSDLDPKRVNTVQLHYRTAIKYFYDEGIGRSRVRWSLGAAPTEAWARKVFPELSGAEAVDALWESIFSIVRADRPDFLDAWKTHNESLKRRAESLNSLNIRTLHFTGPGTDLSVLLSPKALFRGGGDSTPDGCSFEPNIPTEEVYTTPDWRGTQGKFSATRPFFINGKLIEGLEGTFVDGDLVEFHAREGNETFGQYISSDAGARRLGEVALVGIDSPVYQSGRVYQEILFDENAACHLAVGSAYKFCLDGGTTLDADALSSLGCNESVVHTDMMISSDQVDVWARTYDGRELKLIDRGAWVVE